MDPLFAWVEASWPSRWLRESLSIFAFPMVLTLHTLGLALLAGSSSALCLRLLGVARQVPVGALAPLLSLAWCGFWLNAVTGLALVWAYPTKALTNLLFYGKLALVALGVVLLLRLRRHCGGGPASPAPERTRATRRLAALLLGTWVAAIFAGRFLAYTYQRLLVGH